jgi:hypothetical protein
MMQTAGKGGTHRRPQMDKRSEPANSVTGYHRGHRFSVRYLSTWSRADVDVTRIEPISQYRFELAIFNPEECQLGARLTETVKCWIDGAINRRED